jgi:hypothetical protein
VAPSSISSCKSVSKASTNRFERRFLCTLAGWLSGLLLDSQQTRWRATVEETVKGITADMQLIQTHSRAMEAAIGSNKAEVGNRPFELKIAFA